MLLSTKSGEGRGIVKVDGRLTSTTTTTAATALTTTLTASVAAATVAAETTALVLLNETLFDFNVNLLLLGLVLLLQRLTLKEAQVK